MRLVPKDKEQQMPCLFRRFAVRDLFGMYSYDFTVPETDAPESGKLLLLYGDNGSGKTTILNLIYHLLSPEPYEGHRSFVGRCPFSLVEIGLSNGATVRAERTSGNEPGVYKVAIFDSEGAQFIDWSWHPERTGREPGHEEEYQRFCAALRKSSITFYYLRDTRRVAGAGEMPPAVFYEESSRRTLGTRRARALELEDGELTHAADWLLHESVERATQWFRQQALAGTNIGSSSVNSIYKDIIARIVTYGESESAVGPDSVEPLKVELQRLRERNHGFSKFGLTPSLEIDELLGSLDSAGSQNVPLLKTVLGPYLDGHKARLDALQEVQRVMDAFVSLLCSFYSHKEVSVHLRDGLTVQYTGTKQDIDLSTLSSGEKQLLLLLCHAVSVRGPGIVFMIDEPEISLNIKWQRKFVQALLTCLSGTDSQIILATHSIELLAQYKDYVVSLGSAS